MEQADAEYLIRGKGYIKSLKDLEDIVVGADMRGTPIYVKNLGTVQLGGAIRRGLLDMNGEGEAVGGIIVMRYGENAKDVIDRVKEKITSLEKGLPPGVKIMVSYDRSDLIERAIDTLKRTLTEESIVVSLVVLLFLLHFQSALVIVITLPIAVLYFLHHHEADGGHLQHHVPGGDCHRHRRAGGCRGHHGGELLPPPLRAASRGAEGKAAGGNHHFAPNRWGGPSSSPWPSSSSPSCRSSSWRDRKGNCFIPLPSPRPSP